MAGHAVEQHWSAVFRERFSDASRSEHRARARGEDRASRASECSSPKRALTEYIIFEKFPSVTIERPEKFGGNLTFHSYQELETAFAEGKLHPMDAKKGCGVYVNLLLEPVRQHFETNAEAKRLKELVDSWQVTR